LKREDGKKLPSKPGLENDNNKLERTSLENPGKSEEKEIAGGFKQYQKKESDIDGTKSRRVERVDGGKQGRSTRMDWEGLLTGTAGEELLGRQTREKF